MKYQCGCPEFWHYWCCKHSLGSGIHKNQTNVPEDNDFEIDTFAARGRGRPVIAEGGGALTPTPVLRLNRHTMRDR